MPAEDEPVVFLQDNPKMRTSSASARYAHYSAAGTLKEARALGMWPGDAIFDLKHGFLVSGRDLRRLPIVSAIRLFAPAPDASVAFSPENPKRANTKSWKRYEGYKSARSLRQAVEGGMWPGDIRNDLGKGFIRRRGAGDPTAAKAKSARRAAKRAKAAEAKTGRGCINKGWGALRAGPPKGPASSSRKRREAA